MRTIRTSRIAECSRLSLALALVFVAGACDDKEAAAPPRSDVEAAAKAKDAKAPAAADAEPAADVADGRVWFVSPKDGAKVGRKFEVEFGCEGKTIVPAAGTERDAKVGHHHIIIDGGPMPDGQVVPKDEKHLHYGDGSTRTTLLLPPGEHKLTMQLGDGLHQSYGPKWAETITVTVSEDVPDTADPAGAGPGGAPAHLH